MSHQKILPSLSLLLVMALGGCQENPAPVSVETAASKRSTEWLLEKMAGCLPKHFSLEHLTQLIEDGDLSAVSRYVNLALQTAVDNPYLHIINGFIYEEMERRGDSSRVELAGIAYRSAYSLDTSNWLSAYLLGSYELRLQKYNNAQEHLAQAIILRPNDPDILYSLAYCSYYLGDIPVAFSTIEKAVALRPKDPVFNRAAAIIAAASARFSKAEHYHSKYKSLLGEDHRDVVVIAQRIEDWKAIHNKAMVHATAQETPGQKDADDTLIPNDMIGDLLQEALKETPKEAKKDPATPADPNAPAAADAQKKEPPSIVFDCYLLRTDDRSETNRGQNIMENLSVLLGGTTPKQAGNDAIASIKRTITGTTTPAPTSVTGGWQKVFNYAIYPVVLNYSLNIANAQDILIEVIARPTIATLLGKQATFLSGDQYTGVADGAIGAATAAVDAGIKLDVKPTDLLPDGRIFLDISITESLFVAPPILKLGINEQMIGTTKGKITATVRAAFGQTVVIGGLYSRSTIRNKSGFPLLQDLPFIQYFFATEKTQSILTSTVYLVTPRQGGSIQECGSGLCPPTKDAKVREKLQERGLMSIGEYPNLYYILKYLANTRTFVDFRSGDLLTPFWGYDSCTLREKISQLSSFLFF